jgi:hypothetical protein
MLVIAGFILSTFLISLAPKAHSETKTEVKEYRTQRYFVLPIYGQERRTLSHNSPSLLINSNTILLVQIVFMAINASNSTQIAAIYQSARQANNYKEPIGYPVIMTFSDEINTGITSDIASFTACRSGNKLTIIPPKEFPKFTAQVTLIKE